MYVFIKNKLAWFLITLILFIISGCSVKTTTVNLVAGALSKESSGSVFSGDDDPELVGEALPFAIKLYESLVAGSPNNQQLLLATGKSLCMYAYAFIQVPAEQLSYSELEMKEEMLVRAKRLYLRGRDYILKALDLRHPHFKEYLDKNDFAAAFHRVAPKDTSYLYWAGMAWMAAFTADKGDVELMVDIPKVVALINKVMEFNDGYAEGSAHEFFISYYGGMPAAMGGSEEKARGHFAKAISYSKGYKTSPYIALATTVCVKNQNLAEFKSLLEIALKVDVNKKPGNRLLNILNQQKARWLLEHADNYFLPAEGDTLR
jgi:predicted anti-sigma-YlaC factor YlaD